MIWRVDSLCRRMNKNLAAIIFCLLVLAIFLIIGTPFEFMNPVIDGFATLCFALAISAMFVLLFKLARSIEKRLLKRVLIGLIGVVAIPYLLTGIWILVLTGGNYYPMWQDISIYKNQNGEKIISQWRETSGSIFDYRNRRIIADFGQFRISYDCDIQKLKGIWTEYNMETHTIHTIDFDKRRKGK